LPTIKLPVTLTKPLEALKKEHAAFVTTEPLVGLETEQVAPLRISIGRNCEPSILT
jgi:hypothetical protein